MKKVATAFLTTMIGATSGAVSVFTTMNRKINKWKTLNRKNDAILKVYSQWLSLKQQGKSLADYFRENGYQKIAIYGMHYLGESLYSELQDTGIEVKYAIDQKADSIHGNLDIYIPGEELAILEEVDVVVVTAFYFYDDIEDLLIQYLNCPIVSIKDVIAEL